MANTARIRELIHPAAARAERLVDGLRHKLLPHRGPVHIHPYVGHGNAEFIVVRGRVLADPPLDVDAPDGPAWRRALEVFNRFESDEVPGVEVEIEIDGEKATAVTDDEGYYEARLPTGSGGGLWRHGTATARGATAEVAAVVPDAAPGDLLVISDIDDTVLETGAQRFWQMARATIFGTFRTRSHVAGMAELYRGLVYGPTGDTENPVFYVSSSPWNLHDFLTAFIDHRGLPRGPLFLRDLGIDESVFIKSGHGDHKGAAIDEILDTHPARRAILVGDTGQHDPEIYTGVARARPDRIAAIYLRDVADPERDAEVDELARGIGDLGTEVVRAEDPRAFAAHARDAGFLAWGDRQSVDRAVGRAGR